MNRPQQAPWWLAGLMAVQFAVLPLCAADDAPVAAAPFDSFPAPASILPPSPQFTPPVDFFRKLLAMSARERANFLTNKPPEVRERLLAKVREYQLLDPNERELRLRATEVRWYVFPFFHTSLTNHAAQLALVPDELRDLVKARVQQWDLLPPPMQKEFLENERTLHFFTHVEATNRPPSSGHESHHNLWEADQARWNALSPEKRRELTNRFNQFFELTASEKQKALNTLSDTERLQMEKTLQSFDKLPAGQRLQCIRAYAKFAGMSPAERAEFLKNAERWAQMSPQERQAWRDVVANVPQWPPLPTALIMPPMPPPSPTRPPRATTLVTNQN